MTLTVHGMSMGWHPDLPDIRDYTNETEGVRDVLSESQQLRKVTKSLPKAVDLRPWCSPIEDQGQLGSCTANAGVGLYEYFERRAHGKHLDASRLFLYKVTRKLMGLTGDTGAYLRDTMKAMVLFGVPPERYWPYRIDRYDVEPNAFLYSFAQSFQALKYYRLDPPAAPPDEVLLNVRTSLAGELPCMFGFTVYESIPPSGDGKGEIPCLAPTMASPAATPSSLSATTMPRRSGPARAPSSSATHGAPAGGWVATAGCPTTTSAPAWPTTSGRS